MVSYHDGEQGERGDFQEDSETSRTPRTSKTQKTGRIQRTRTTPRPKGPGDSEDREDLEGPGSDRVADANAYLPKKQVVGRNEEQVSGEHHRLFKAGRYGDIPVPVFIEIAAQESSDISRNYSEWKSVTWEFARSLKAHPKLTHLTADEVPELIDFEAIGFDDDDAMQFLLEWNRVRFIPGVKPLDWAADMAKKKPLASKRRFARYDHFLSIAAWLQVLVGRENAIFLPTEKVGELLGCTARQVSTLRQLAVQDKLLEVVEQHQPRRRATRFKFLGECPALEKYE